MRYLATSLGVVVLATSLLMGATAIAGENSESATAVVKGTATLNKAGIANEDVSVRAVPNDPNSEAVASDRTNRNGKYRVENLAPGTYRLAFVTSVQGHTPHVGGDPRVSVETDCKVRGYDTLAFTTRGDYPAPGEPAPTLTVLQLTSERPFRLKADQVKTLNIRITCPKGTKVAPPPST